MTMFVLGLRQLKSMLAHRGKVGLGNMLNRGSIPQTVAKQPELTPCF